VNVPFVLESRGPVAGMLRKGAPILTAPAPLNAKTPG
jgi:hypothetical protein